MADLAGVSFKTVSRVINKESGVKGKTRVKVVQAIDKLNYRPLQSARIMRSKKSGIIGLITSAISYSGNDPRESGLSSIHIIRGVHQACRELGFRLMISDTEGDPDEVKNLIDIFASYQVEGIIVTADRLQQVHYPFLKTMPAILVNCFDEFETLSVIPNDYQGQQLATRYLMGLGHMRIGLMGLPEDNLAFAIRRRGFEETCQQEGWSAQNYTYLSGGHGDLPHVFANLEGQLKKMLHEGCKPTAIMFGNDIMALRAMRYLASQSIDVPDQCSMVGFDNDVRICENLHPALTTVELPYYTMGHRAVYRLVKDNDQDSRNVEHIDCELIVRRSSKELVSS